MEELEEGQIVSCIVENIAGTTVFVKIDGYTEGTITTSEIAPGRIRNLRVYVTPGKRIVCKVLSIKNGRIQLSLRRVKQNEKKELLDKMKKEQNYTAILKTVLGKEKAEQIINKIANEQSLIDFFNDIRERKEKINNLIDKKDLEKIISILDSKKEKPKEIKNIIKLSNKSPNGINIVKEIITNSCKDSKCITSYIAAGKYSISITGENFKDLKSDMNQVIENIEKSAKKQSCDFSLEKS